MANDDEGKKQRKKIEKAEKLKRKVEEFYECYGKPSGDELTAYFVAKLEKSTRKLNCLTKTLIFLTVILTIIAIIDIISRLCPN